MLILQNQLNVPLYHPILEPDHKQQNANALLRYQVKSTQLASSLLSELQLVNNKDSEKIKSVLFNECGPGMDLEPDTFVQNNAQSTTVKHSMTLRRIAIRLIVGRSFISSLDHDQQTTMHLSALACDAVRHVKDNPGEGQWLSCKYQMTSVVAGALLALGYFVLQDCSDHPDVNLQTSSRYTMHIEHFMDATEILSELAIHNLYARRVRDDFSTITSVVARINERIRMLAFSRGGVNHFDYEDAKDLIPTNILDNFPYTASSPDLRSGVLWLL